MDIPPEIKDIRAAYANAMDGAWQLRQRIPRASLPELFGEERTAAEFAVDTVRQREVRRMERTARRKRDAAVLNLALQVWEV